MKFEWDQNKSIANYVKHKINFEFASQVFDDPLVAVRLESVVNSEERWLAVGQVCNQFLLVVVHTYRTRDNLEVIRIISARHATSHERRMYEEG